MTEIERVLAFHTQRGTLADFGLTKLADSIAKATTAMQESLAAEAAALEARQEAQRVHDLPLSQNISDPEDLICWSVDGRLPNLDTVEIDGRRHAFSRPPSLFMFVVPARFVDAVPLREASGWDYCRARDVLRLAEIGGSHALQLIESIPIGLALYRHLSASTHRNSIAAASKLKERLVQIGRDPTQEALPHASFHRAWQAQNLAADRIMAMVRAASPDGVIAPLASDPDDAQRALADQQTRDSLAKLQLAELARADQANREATASAKLLASIARDVADLKRNASTATEIPQ